MVESVNSLASSMLHRFAHNSNGASGHDEASRPSNFRQKLLHFLIDYAIMLKACGQANHRLLRLCAYFRLSALHRFHILPRIELPGREG